jgi:hypothetical protein
MVDLVNCLWKSLIFREGWHKQPSLKIIFSEAVLFTEPPLKMNAFLEVDFLMEPPLKIDFQQRSRSYSAPNDVRGGVLV